jgi:hypothetical protein
MQGRSPSTPSRSDGILNPLNVTPPQGPITLCNLSGTRGLELSPLIQ